MGTGTFYVIEGLDASGKTTVATFLKERLNAVFPQVDMNGAVDENLLYDKNYYRALNKVISSEIKRLLEHHDVIQVRYIYSNIVNEFLVDGRINTQTPGIAEPDHIIYLYTDIDEIERRMGMRDKRSERETRENSKKMMKVYDYIFNNDPRVIRVDTTHKTPEETVEEILQKLNK